MFVVNTEITVNYLLNSTALAFLYTDFDVRVIKPDGSFNFYDSAILEENYISPTTTTTGAVSYPFTPDVEGVWTVALSKGTAPNYDVYNEYTLRIVVPDTHVRQQVDLG